MSEAAVALGALLVVCMMGVGLALFVKGARETFDTSSHPDRPHQAS